MTSTCTYMYYTIHMYIFTHLHSSVKPSVRAVLFGSVAMENTVSQDAPLVVLNVSRARVR